MTSRRYARGASLGFVALAVAVSALLVCQNVAQGSTGPGGSITPPGTSNCLHGVVTLDGPERTTARLALAADTVVIANVTKAGPARWNTPDGRRPVIVPGQPVRAAIYRTVTFDVGSVTKGSIAGSGQQEVDIFGGAVGCDTFRITGIPFDLVAGPYVVFLTSGQAAIQTSDPQSVLAMWPISQGLVQTEAEGPVTAETWQARVLGARNTR
jgi:hypothetical protein